MLDTIAAKPSARNTRLVALTILPSLLSLLIAGIASAQVIRSDLWTTDGQVRAAALSESTLYVGGTFTYVGPRTGGGSAADTTAGGATGFPRVEGAVNVAIADGAGGWYVGGVFSAVGGVPRNHLAHITATNLVDPGFAPNPSAQVNALALSGTTLYIGGGFVVVGGQTRLGAAAVNTATGSVLPWNPAPNGTIQMLAVIGSTLYAGGTFTTFTNLAQSRNRIAAFDASTGTLLAWNPGANGPVKAIVPVGPNLYVGGGFTLIGGRSRNWLAALDPASDSALAWNPNPVIGVGAGVTSVVARGTTLYVAGSFTTISAQSRNGMAAIDTSGALQAWNPNPNQAVNALAVNGSIIYAGGNFTSIGGQTRFRTAALNAVSGTATAWTGHASDFVNTLAMSGSKLFIGGFFTSVGGVPRTNLAALNLVTGTATTFDPSPNNIVRALTVSASTLYVGGDFTQAGGQTRGRLAAFSLATGSLLPWNPNSSSGNISALAYQGTVVYAGGAISTIGGQPRTGLAGIDAASGLVTGWNPQATGGAALALIANGATVYVGGNFTNVGGSPRNFIAALDTMGGTALGFNPTANNGVNALALRDSTLYLGGGFTLVGGQGRNRIAAVNAVTGAVTPWNPNATSSSVSAITVDEGAVYAGGGFAVIGGANRNSLAALDVATGQATSWNPNPNSSTFALTTGGGTIFAGGQFSTIGTQSGSSAAIDASCAPPLLVGASSPTLGAPRATAMGDFDGDGTSDLAIASVDGGQVLRGHGDGTFTALSSVSLGLAGRGLATSDFNYDFAPDLAVSTLAGVNVMLGLKANGQPTGGFGSPTTYSVGTSPAGIAVNDFNEDGVSDLAVAVSGANSVKILLGGGANGLGDGSFAAPTSFTVGTTPKAVAVADFNADGIWDLAVSDSASNAVSILLGQGAGGMGNGSFAAAVNYPVANGPGPIVTGDFNEDLVQDLGLGTTNSVAVLLGNGLGNGTFNTAVVYPVGGPVTDLIAADFDANGRVDLGATLGATGTFQYLYGDGSSVVGNGAFLTGPSIPLGGDLSALEFGVFDGAAPGGSLVVARADQANLVAVGTPCTPATPPLLEMTSPNGGEIWDLGNNVPVQWARNELVPAVHVEISRDGGTHWRRIASNLTGTEFRWTTAPPGSLTGRVRIVDAQRQALADPSNGNVRMQPLLGVGSPIAARPSFSSGYPNPANGSVRFDLVLPLAAPIAVEVFDVAGRRIQTLTNGPRAAGHHVILWNGRTSSGRARDGVFFVRARMPGFEAVRRVVRIE